MNLVLVLEEDGEGMTMNMQFHLIQLQCSAEVISPFTIFLLFRPVCASRTLLCGVILMLKIQFVLL